MTGILESTYPGLGFNPAPGNLAAITELSMAMTSSQRMLTEALHLITSVGRSDTWEGDAANAFLSKVGQLPSKLQEAEDSFGTAAKDLNGWQNELASMQQRAQELEQEAVTACQQVQTAQANPALQLAGRTVSSSIQLEEDQREYDAAVHELSMAEGDLNAIIEQANRLLAQHTGLAQEAAKAIDAAAQLAPDAPGLFDQLLGDLENVIEGRYKLMEDLTGWIRAHANGVNAIGDMLALAGTVYGTLGLAADIMGQPEIGEGLDGVAGVLSAAALAAHGIAWAGGASVTGRTFAEDALGVVSFGVAKGTKAMEASTIFAKYMTEGDSFRKAADLAGIVAPWQDAAQNPSSLGVFWPHSWKQGGEWLLGGPLLVGFQNAWHDGSAQDRAAHGGG
ncbi:uncharacterized protein YukE [Streptacidiphilus sp. BW17]|uniref:putative T7SS-secreted protein n=1 Tax=Streptacidiphilus sp. BW17 TaxID=3156274 RepID=UPI0035136E16